MCQENMKACRQLLEPIALRGPALVARGDSTAASDIEVESISIPTKKLRCSAVAGIAEELRKLPGVRVDADTSGAGLPTPRLKSLKPTWNASRNVASIADPDYFEAPQGADARLAVKRCREALAAFEALTLAADSEDDGTMGDWTSSGGRPPMTGHLWADALMGVAIALLLM